MNYGRAIRTARAVRDMPQRELARLAELNPSYISLIESGKRTPSTKALETIGKILGFPVPLLVILASSVKEYDRLDDETRGVMGIWFMNALMGKTLWTKPSCSESPPEH